MCKYFSNLSSVDFIDNVFDLYNFWWWMTLNLYIEGWDGGREGGSRGGDIYIIMTDLHSCMVEPIQHVKINKKQNGKREEKPHP